MDALRRKGKPVLPVAWLGQDAFQVFIHACCYDQNGKGCLHVRHGLLGGSQWFIAPFGVPAD